MVSIQGWIKTSERLRPGAGTLQTDTALTGPRTTCVSPIEGRMMPLTETGVMQGTAASRSWVVFLIRHCLGGMVVGWTVVGGLLWLDVAGLGDLVITSDLFPMPLLMLLALFGITFGSVAVGSAIMGLGRCGDAAGTTRSRVVPSGPAAPRKIQIPF